MTKICAKLKGCAAGGDGSVLYYQVTHGRQVRSIRTSYQLLPSEWDAKSQAIVIPSGDAGRAVQLHDISWRMNSDVARLYRVLAGLCQGGTDFSADDVVSKYDQQTEEGSLRNLMEGIIREKTALGGGAVRTAEAYASTLKSFMRFTGDKDVPIDAFCPELLKRYEDWLLSEGRVNGKDKDKDKGVSRATSSFYMKHLRAVFNVAVSRNLVAQTHPFRAVFNGNVKTSKLAYDREVIREVADADLSDDPRLAFARCIFLLSICTQGMSFVDMAYLTLKNLVNGRLEYTRRKSGSRVSVKWHEDMQRLVDALGGNSGAPYLLPIITRAGSAVDERRQLLRMQARINRDLKRLSKRLHIARPLSMNAARHTWATWAYNIADLSVASAGLAHQSEQTTRTYLGKFDLSRVDAVCVEIRDILFGRVGV